MVDDRFVASSVPSSLGDAEKEMGNPLTMDRYADLEARDTAEIPLPILTAFSPVTYHRNNVKVALNGDADLIRYVDHNFESETSGLYEPGASFPGACYVNRFTPAEKGLVDTVRDKVAGMSQSLFGRAVRPMSNLLVQIAPFRILSELAQLTGQAGLSIYEAGPGLGYLGTLLAATGHRYASYDVTPALYVWQSRLMREMVGREFQEAVFHSHAGVGDPLFTASRVLHLPWWRHYELFGRFSRPIDVIYSNSNICEMHTISVRLLMRRALPVLQASPLGLFIFMSWGYPGQGSAEDLHAEFLKEGYRRVQGNLPFKAYVPAERDTSVIERAFAGGIPLYNPDRSEARLSAREMVAVRRAEAPIDVAATMEYYGWEPPFLD